VLAFALIDIKYIRIRTCPLRGCVEQLAAPGAAPVGDVTVASVLRQLGPRAPGLLHVDPREIGLADIDVAGLAPLASLFG